MMIEEAARILAEMYRQGKASRQASVHVHLFAIKYADQLEGMPLAELVERAGIDLNYKTEIRKGLNLAKFVQLKP